MQEISTGVYVGNFNSKIREKLRERVVGSVGSGEATMTYAYRNEIGYSFKTHNSSKISIDFDGIPLVFTPREIKNDKVDKKLGFSKVSKMRKISKFGNKESKRPIKPYIIIDIETTGLNPLNDRIIEIGAIKIGEEIEEFTTFVKQEVILSQKIKNLTGISEKNINEGVEEEIAIDSFLEFIGGNILVGYNINFDLKFINEALRHQGKSKLTNKTYDVMKYVKNDKMFLSNYKLENVLKEYNIEKSVPHRALEDVKIIGELILNLDKLVKKLEK
ncbi:type I-E CRISPR-associated endoribonuclease Cas2 [Anaerococcus sp. NML200537]|nr:type I-E CRISPR-associated endoribonuclease Cas2 [Anaerococcus sp. NML200537]